MHQWIIGMRVDAKRKKKSPGVRELLMSSTLRHPCIQKTYCKYLLVQHSYTLHPIIINLLLNLINGYARWSKTNKLKDTAEPNIQRVLV